MTLRVLVPIVLAAAVAAAAAQPAGKVKAQPTREVKLDTPFELKPKESVKLDKLAVGLVGVAADSRCPVDVTCVWAGDAAVEITLERPPAKRDSFVLHTMHGSGAAVDYEGFSVRLEAVNPRPRLSQKIAAEDYRVTLVIRRAK